MKKTIALIIAMVTVCAFLPASAVSFTDIAAGHWAYASISELVEKGTIKGYTDGSFRPDNTVTRAEFVKMVGEGSEKRKNDFSDVTPNHWAYNYVMTSGFASDDRNNFNPDTPITRAQTVELLYSRFGKADTIAPEFVNIEAEKFRIKKDALSWIYTYGVLVGDDGVNLRLGDTLTRAEAAALIVKCGNAKEAKDFVDVVSDGILKNTFNSLGVFDEEYSSEKTVTNAQLAKAAVKFANCTDLVNFNDYYIKSSIEHENSNELYIMCNSDIGLNNFTVEFANAQATVKTAEMAIKNAAERLIAGTITEAALIYLDAESKAADAVTHKELAALMLQYDTVFGSQFAYTTELDGEEYTKVNVKMETDIRQYPVSYKNFAVVLKDIPDEVYNYPLTSGSGTSGTPAELYDFARDYSNLFVAKCADYVKAAKAVFGADIEITFYPSLAYNNGNGFAFRVKVKALNANTCTPADMFGESAITNKNKNLFQGMEFFAEISAESLV